MGIGCYEKFDSNNQYSLSPSKFSNSLATAVKKVAPKLPSTIR